MNIGIKLRILPVVCSLLTLETLDLDDMPYHHRGPTQCVCVADCCYIVNALDLPFASPIAIYR